jgi:hypothetical protein
MTGKELLKAFENGNSITMKFDESVGELQSMFNKDMKADVVDVYEDQGCVLVEFDQTKYYEDNKVLVETGWYNKDTGEHDLTYGEYCTKENIVFDIW